MILLWLVNLVGLFYAEVILTIIVSKWPGRQGFNSRSSHAKDSKNSTRCLTLYINVMYQRSSEAIEEKE